MSPDEIVIDEQLSEPGAGETAQEGSAETDLNKQIGQLHEASDLLPAGSKDIVDRLFQDIESAQTYKEKKKLWVDFFTNNPQAKEYVKKLREIQGMVDVAEAAEKTQAEGQEEAQPTDDQLKEAVDKFVEAADELEPKMVDALYKQITEILAGEPIDDAKKELIKLKLAVANIPETAWDGFFQELAVENLSDEQLKAHIQKLVAENFEATVGTMADATEYKEQSGQYVDLLAKAKNMSPDDPSRRELMNQMTKSTSDLLDDFPMDGFLDLVFATGHGGGYYHGRHEQWGETSNEKEMTTLETLEGVLEEREGAELFFAKLTDTHRTEVWQDLLPKLDIVFSRLDGGDNNSREAVKKLISESVLEASGAPGLGSVELKVEDINLSPDVLKMMVKRAKKHLDAQQAK